MTSNEAAIQEGDELLLAAPPAPASNRAAWRHVPLNVAYVLLAGPLGLNYLLLLTIGLALDLPWLAIRVLVAAALSLFRNAWRVARSSLHRDRERVRTLWLAGTAPSPTTAVPIHERVLRFFDAYADGMKRISRHVAPERWVFIPAICWRLVMWERRHTMHWLNIELPSLEAPRHTPADRTARISQVPIASLGYVLAKVPLGALVMAVILLAVGAGGIVREFLTHPTVLILVTTAQALLVIYVLHMLAQASARFAQRVFSPTPAVRRLQAAESLVAQARMQAERAEQSRRDLIINVGHELRTPTASILGHVESLLLALDAPDGDLQPETLRRYLAIVEREAERLSSLVDDLLAVARAERAELQLALAPVDAAAVIHEVYQALAPLARRDRQVVLVHEEQPGLPYVHADRQRLSQVLFNLVRNAITYTPAGGIVSIELRRTHGNRVLLTVADTGSGIASGDLERVFERFYRADASRARIRWVWLGLGDCAGSGRGDGRHYYRGKRRRRRELLPRQPANFSCPACTSRCVGGRDVHLHLLQ